MGLGWTCCSDTLGPSSGLKGDLPHLSLIVLSRIVEADECLATADFYLSPASCNTFRFLQKAIRFIFFHFYILARCWSHKLQASLLQGGTFRGRRPICDYSCR